MDHRIKSSEIAIGIKRCKTYTAKCKKSAALTAHLAIADTKANKHKTKRAIFLPKR